jgi:hypothetical protein
MNKYIPAVKDKYVMKMATLAELRDSNIKESNCKNEIKMEVAYA